MNTISDILHSMRLTGGVFLEAEFTAPWAVRARVTPEDCSPYMQAPREIIAYHLITAGQCVILLDDGQSMLLKRGDLVLLPRNSPHILTTGIDIPPVPADQLIQEGSAGGMARIVHGGGGERTQMLCGFLGSATENVCLAALLPEALRLGSEDWPAARWIETTFRFAVQESARGQADSREALARLAELLFLEAVRRYFTLHPRSHEAALAGMRDNLVGRALMVMHKRLYEPWTTEALARQIGLSRSSFAERFTRALGEPPMRYLAHRRLEQASLRLRDTAEAINRIAYEAGYESDSAFSRAFRRMYGAPPATWRRNMAPTGGEREAGDRA